MGKACRGWEAWQVQRSGVRGLYLVAIGQVRNDRFVGRLDVGDVRTGGEKIARCARVQNGPFVDGFHVYDDCAEECGGGKGIRLGGGRASRQYIV